MEEPDVATLLARCTFPPAGTAVTCAVSGGADSTALLVLACAAELDVTAAHVDHGLRPGSAREADVVRTTAERFGARFVGLRADLPPGPNQEARARGERLRLLGPDALTGHTADDQAETLLINLLRGAGAAGLAAMIPGPTHPLLGLRRLETEALCVSVGADVVRDPTNDDPRFVRNRIRHEVLPLLADVSGRDVVPILNRTSRHLRSLDDGINGLAAGYDPSDTRELAAAPPLLARAALRRWLTDAEGHPPSSAELDRVMAVVRHDARACELSGGRTVTRSDGVLRLVETR
ncbi:MAG: tRNA lysidine(34) synthetase TilS [Actinomycetota bacterium]|nr:tRNA lysidine(34) synthetase TilS [Actinomycetota bacterium]